MSPSELLCGVYAGEQLWLLLAVEGLSALAMRGREEGI